MARVLFRGQWFVGELLYSYDFPWKRADENGLVVETVRRPQRADLLVDGSVIHFTVPTEVRVIK